MPISILNRQAVELFHLLFLQQLGARLDKKFYALKGGCNLRFFFRSIRYSEDLDLDTQTIAKETLRKNVNRILQFQGFTSILHSHRLGISFISEPKQTATTQRWKIHLRLLDSSAELPTKIEFSRRGFRAGTAFEPIDSEIARLHRLRPVLATHYTLETAFTQKVEALIHRTETQARDVFDLHLLLDAGAEGTELAPAVRKKLGQACENAIGIQFDDFQGQVVAYLAPEYQDYYGMPVAWEKLQENVVANLEAL
jgi:predicted nucleotidyltransferase component of viral defense system